MAGGFDSYLFRQVRVCSAPTWTNFYSDQPYLFGETLTESDLYLLPTLARFDSIYHTLFNCSYRRVADYPALTRYLQRLHSNDILREVYDHQRAKVHYYQSVMHVDGDVLDLNPTHIIPMEPFDSIYQPQRQVNTKSK